MTLPAMPPPADVRPAHPLRASARVATIAIALAGLEALVNAMRASAAEGPHYPLSQVLLFLAGIMFILWLSRARTNLDVRDPGELTWSSGWAAGAWLVPVANLVLPLLVVNEIDRVSARRAGGHRSAVFALWSTLWTLFLMCSLVSAVILIDLAPGAATMLVAVTSAVEVGAAISAILLIRRITHHQDRLLQGTP